MYDLPKPSLVFFVFISVIFHFITCIFLVVFGGLLSKIELSKRDVYNISIVSWSSTGVGPLSVTGGLDQEGLGSSVKTATKSTSTPSKGSTKEIGTSGAYIKGKEVVYSKVKKSNDEAYVKERVLALREEVHLDQALRAIGRGTHGGKEVFGYEGAGGFYVGVSIGGVSNVDPILSIYVGKVVRKIQMNWSYPSQEKGLEAIVVIKIDRSGRIVDIFFEKRSGSKVFDASVYQAIRFSSPFSPLPETWKYDYMELGIRFRL